MKKKSIFFLVILFPFINSFSQVEELADAYRENFKKKYFNLGILFQGYGDFQKERSDSISNGFSLANVRTIIQGELDESFGYYIQNNYMKAPSLLDARIYFIFSKSFIVDFGQYKSPISGEYLLPESDIDLANRSLVADNLNMGRQIGLQFRGQFLNDNLAYRIGVFNGNGTTANANNNDKYMYAARLTFTPKFDNEETVLKISLNGGFNDLLNTSVKKKNTTLGGDFRFTHNKIMVSGEYLNQKLSYQSGSDVINYGYHFTAGYMVAPKIQALVRWDYLKAESLNLSDGKFLIIGANFFPTSITVFQFNYVVDTDNSKFDYHKVFLTAQLWLN